LHIFLRIKETDMLQEVKKDASEKNAGWKYSSGLTRKIFWISILFVLIISFLDLIGWITGISWLKGGGIYWTPMKIITALSFIFISLTLIMIFTKSTMLVRRIFSFIAGSFLIITGSLSAIAWFSYGATGQEASFTTMPFFRLFLAPVQRMALLTSIIFILTGIMMFLLNSEGHRSADLAHILCFPVAIAGYIVPVSYILGVYSIHDFLGTAVALNTGLAFCAICTAIFLIHPDTWLMKVFLNRDSGGIMARRLLPWLLVLPVVIAWFRIYGEHQELFDSEVGVLLVALTYSICFILLVWFTARSLNRIDRKRFVADEALKKSYEELEERVAERTSELLILNKALDSEIKERVKAEKMVESEHQRMNGLLELMPAYIILLTRDYHVAYSNRFFRERFGESHGKRCFEFLFNRSEVCETCDTYKVLKDGLPHKWEWTGPDKHIYSIFDFPYADHDGTPLIMEMGIDITDLKTAESNLVTLNAELEQRVKNRTSELEKINERLNILSHTSSDLLASENPQKLINSLCTRVLNFLDCQLSFNFLTDESKDKLHLNSYAGISEKEARKIEYLESGVGVCGCAARDAVRIVAENIQETPDPRTDFVRSFGVQAYACLPLLSKDKVLGTLSFGTVTRTQFSEDDLSMMKAVADLVALAIGRVRNEDEIRRSEERYRSLMELSPSASFVSRNNRIVLINSAAKDLLGLGSSEEVLGKSPFEIFHPDYREQVRTRINKILSGKKVPMAAGKIVRGDGSVRDVEVVAAGITDSEGIAIQVIMNDITERILAEKELFDTKKYLQNLIDYANAPIIVWDYENKIRLFNHAFEHLTGYLAPEIEGKKLDLLFPKNTLRESMAKIRHALTENWVTIEIPILTRNQEIRTVLWNSAKIYDDNRKTYSIIAQGNDITERINAERAFQVSKEKLEIALENGKIGTWEWEKETDKFSLDQRMKKMFGTDSSEFDNTYEGFENRIHEEDLPHVRNAFSQALRDNIPLDTVFRIKNNSEGVNYISTKALVERDNQGNPVKISGVCFDITEMKKGAEKALFELNEDLLRSNRELEQFAYVASHDLQEPLRMVSSFTQLLSQRYKDKLDHNAQEFIQYAVEGAARMQVLINDLLNYSRVGTKGIRFVTVNMHNPLTQALNNLDVLIREKKAIVTSDDFPEIVADEGQMVQLLQNLIMNGLKFSRKDPRIRISAIEENDRFVFSVKDNGIGIDPRYFDKIFQIFQRLHPRDQYGGTGIGLAICKRIIERHGGKIWVESKPGKGSIFYFTILKR
jgi:PAS domain S-box-containing protein